MVGNVVSVEEIDTASMRGSAVHLVSDLQLRAAWAGWVGSGDLRRLNQDRLTSGPIKGLEPADHHELSQGFTMRTMAT